MKPSDDQLAIVAEQLGRTPRGVLAIAYTTPVSYTHLTLPTTPYV